MTDLTHRMADDMKLRHYSQRTIDDYTYHLGKFAEFPGRLPLEATAEDVRSFHKGSGPDPIRAITRSFEPAQVVRSLLDQTAISEN